MPTTWIWCFARWNQNNKCWPCSCLQTQTPYTCTCDIISSWHTHTRTHTHMHAHTHAHTHTHTQPCASGILPTEAKSESLSENSVRIWGGFTLILLLLVYIPLTWHVALAKMKMVNSTTRSSIVKMSKHTTKLCEKLSKHWRDCALCVL